MQYHFELYILSEHVTAEHWASLYKAIIQNGGMLAKFQLHFRCTDNVARYFISSSQNLSGISNTLEGLLFRPVNESEFEMPAHHGKERFIQFPTGGNLLDVKEKYAVKRGRDLEYATFDVRSINIEKAIVKSQLFFKSQGGQWSRATKLFTMFPAKLLAIDFGKNTRYLKKTVPKYLNIEKSLHMLVSDNVDALFEIDTFPYFSHNYYLGINNYDFEKHSLILGASGSGKSKLISLFVDRLYKTALRMNYRVLVIDPHASLAADFENMESTRVINFNNETTELFSGASADISAATELTATLFKSLLADQFNAQLDRTLRFSLFVLMTAQNMSLSTLKRFLTDLELRTQILEHVSGYVPQNIVQFFGSDFNEIRTKNYTTAILPIVSLVDELELQPMLTQNSDVSLARTIQENFLTVFSLNKVSMGEKTVKTVAGLLIQQIFLLAQARVFSQKVILIIDEVSVVQNPALASILAEARKFNLSVILTQQYFGQIEKHLQDAIFANVMNYYTFKVSEEDARALEGNLNIELPKELLEQEYKKGLKEKDIRVKIMTELHPRECLVRLSAKGQINPALKARTMDAPGVQQTQKQADLVKFKQQPAATLPTKFVEDEAQSAAEAPELAPTPAPMPEPPMPQAAVAPAPPAQYAPQTPLPTEGATRGFSLSELLAQNSSRGAKRKQQ